MQTNSQETKSIEDIIKMIDSGKLVLPEFQRDFKWPIDKSETLFDSIFQDLFIGSLIVSKPKFDLACKGFDIRERGSKKHKPKPKQYTHNEFEVDDIYTLLDGQQRTTAIYRAEIKSKGLKVFSTNYLDKLKYPPSKKPMDYYLAIEIQTANALEFENVSWDFKELEEYKKIQEIIKNPYSRVGMPFTVSLTRLMRMKTK